ncbi:hypothetical protein SNE40_010215 [Patella caerulea]|uniref:Uncharacterized protein n=1 Tax=Patella caerulea TaxID=87958 RepID=A0AAN8PZN4_PATCE
MTTVASNDSTTNNTPITSEKAVFFTLKYGANLSIIFNANCKNDILLHYIKRKCQCSDNDMIELSDERGQVKNIRNNRDQYGTKFIKDRENVILLKIDDSIPVTDPKKTKYIPMLVEMQENKAFMDAVNYGKMGEDPNLRRRSSSVGPDHDDQPTPRTKSKTSVSNKRKSIGRRQSSRVLVKR